MLPYFNLQKEKKAPKEEKSNKKCDRIKRFLSSIDSWDANLLIFIHCCLFKSFPPASDIKVTPSKGGNPEKALNAQKDVPLKLRVLCSPAHEDTTVPLIIWLFYFVFMAG